MLQIQRLYRVAGRLADHIQLAFQCIGDSYARAALHEHLADHRLDFFHRFTEIGVVHRHVSPADQHLAFVFDRTLDFVLAGKTRRRLARQKHHAHAVLPSRRQFHALPGPFLAEKLIRHLNQNTRAVGGLGVGTHRATMGQILQYGEALLDDFVTFLALDVRDKADATGVVFIRWVVQTLRGRRVTIAQ